MLEKTIIKTVSLCVVAYGLVGEVMSESTDPTRPTFSVPGRKYLEKSDLATPDFEALQMRLDAIFVNEKSKIAIINNTIFHEGDEVGKIKIKEITSEEVILDVEGKIQKLKLINYSVKQQGLHDK